MLWKYTRDKKYKKQIRDEIVQALGVDEITVKAKLTAYANGSITGIKQHSHYKVFQEESDRLRLSRPGSRVKVFLSFRFQMQCMSPAS